MGTRSSLKCIFYKQSLIKKSLSRSQEGRGIRAGAHKERQGLGFPVQGFAFTVQQLRIEQSLVKLAASD